MKKILPLLLLLSVLFCLIALPAGAQGAIQTDQTGDVLVAFRYESLPIPEGKFYLYRIASVDSVGEYTFLSPYDEILNRILIPGYAVDEWNKAAVQLDTFVRSEKITPDAAVVTGTDGNALVTGLQLGLYLVIGDRTAFGEYFYTPKSGVLMLPEPDNTNNTWNYQVTFQPKVEREKIPVTPPTTTVMRHVIKVWEDTGFEIVRPSSVTVRLFRNGEEYDQVVLSEENSWRYTWTDLPEFDEVGGRNEWALLEDAVLLYSTSIEQNGITFTVTNKLTSSGGEDDDPPEDDEPDPPGGGGGEEPDPPGGGGKDPDPPGGGKDPEPPGGGKDPDPPGGGKDPEPPGIDPLLPQTGLLWWPVPLLFALGVCSLCVGAVCRKKYQIA